MNQYKFSPIQNEGQLIDAIAYIHHTCHMLCKKSFGTYLPVAGNVGIFCHFDDEYTQLTTLQKKLTDSSDLIYGKYYQLYKPIAIPIQDNVPAACYSYLYIRKPDIIKYQVGDIDFYLEPIKYSKLKQSLINGETMKGTRLIPNRPDLDLIELYDLKVDAFAYIGNKKWQ